MAARVGYVLVRKVNTGPLVLAFTILCTARQTSKGSLCTIDHIAMASRLGQQEAEV
jgi:hypothetical protein